MSRKYEDKALYYKGSDEIALHKETMDEYDEKTSKKTKNTENIGLDELATNVGDTENAPNICLFIGNPGVGKSTLLNCIINKKHGVTGVQFESGISIGGGMTSQLQEKTFDDTIYLDTPGLEDTRLRKDAAKAITTALRKNGMYKIFFVTTLESGRVRPTDAATIKIVMECAKEIKHYGIIINKLSRKAFEKLKNDRSAQDNIIAQLKVMDDNTGRETLPVPLFLPLINKLDDEDNAIADVPDLIQFMDGVGDNSVTAQNVDDIPADGTFERQCNLLEQLIGELRYDNEKLKETIRANNEGYQKEQEKLLREMKAAHAKKMEEEKARFFREISKVDSDNHDYVIIENSKTKEALISSVTKLIESNLISESDKLQRIRKLWVQLMELLTRNEKPKKEPLVYA